MLTAVQDVTGLWGIRDEHGGIAYEADFEFEQDAKAIAAIHNETGVVSFEDAVQILYMRGLVLMERCAWPADLRAAPDVPIS